MATRSDLLFHILWCHLQALAIPPHAAALEAIARTGTLGGKRVLEEFPTMNRAIDRIVNHLCGGALLPGGPVDLFQGSRYALRVATAAVFVYLRWQHAAHAISTTGRAEQLKQLVDWCVAQHPGRHVADRAFMVEFAVLADCACAAIDPARETGILRDACNLLLNKFLKNVELTNGFETDLKGKFKRAPGTWAGGSPPAFVRRQLEILWQLTGFTRKPRKRECVSPSRARPANKRVRRDSDLGSSRSGETTGASCVSASGDETERFVFSEVELAGFQTQFVEMFQPEPVLQELCTEPYGEPFAWSLDDAALVPNQCVAIDNHPAYPQSAYERPIDDDFTEEDLQLFEMFADTTVQEFDALLHGRSNL